MRCAQFRVSAIAESIKQDNMFHYIAICCFYVSLQITRQDSLEVGVCVSTSCPLQPCLYSTPIALHMLCVSTCGGLKKAEDMVYHFMGCNSWEICCGCSCNLFSSSLSSCGSSAPPPVSYVPRLGGYTSFPLQTLLQKYALVPCIG